MKFLLSGILLLSTTLSFGQKARIVSECTIVYSLTVENESTSSDMLQTLNGASKVVYIKGSKSRADLESPSYSLSIFSDTRNDTTVVLRRLGNSKYISFLTDAQRREKNKRYEGITFSPTSETKTILGYECKKMVAKLKDGSVYNVFYTPTIIPSSRQYEYQFADLPGLALEYETESEDGNTRYKFTAQKITLTPVAAAKFDIPTSGYRIL